MRLRAASSDDERRVALVEVSERRLDPHRRERAAPPTPSRTYCARRASGSPMYSRDVIQPPPRSFSGRSVSSRYSGTRPTSTRQICAVTSHAADRDGDRQRRAVVAGHERGGEPLGVGVDPVLVLPAAGVDALAEVALAVHEPDRDERQRAVGRLLEDVAGERAEAAGVDRQRAVHAELGAEVGDRALGRRGASARGARGRRARPPRPGRRARGAASRGRAGERLRPVSPSSRTGFSAAASSAPGRSTRRARGRRASTTSGSCRRAARARPAAAARAPPARSAARRVRRGRLSSTRHDRKRGRRADGSPPRRPFPRCLPFTAPRSRSVSDQAR